MNQQQTIEESVLPSASETCSPLPAPIDWDSVAVIAFRGDEAVITARMEPSDLLEEFIDAALHPADEDDRPYSEQKIMIAAANLMRDFVESFRWELYRADDARRVFSEKMSRRPETQPASPSVMRMKRSDQVIDFAAIVGTELRKIRDNPTPAKIDDLVIQLQSMLLCQC